MADFIEQVEIRGYGEWLSPLAPASLAEGTRKVEKICLDGDAIFWVESRPDEAGRSAIMRWTPTTGVEDATSRWFSARTTVNSYGGGALGVKDGVLAFTQYQADAFPKTRDQRVHLCVGGKLPKPITPPVAATYADFELDPAHGVVYAVMEETSVITNGQPTQSLVALDLAGERPPRIIAQGGDFYSSPRLSPDGTQLCWITWNYPSMPWEGTQLWVTQIDPSGAPRDPRMIAGAPAEHIDQLSNPVLADLMRFSDEAIVNPVWSLDGHLYVISDRVKIDGDYWANICKVEGDTLKPVTRETGEYAAPAWRLGGTSFGFASPDRIIACVTRNGTWSLVSVDVASGAVNAIETEFSSIQHLYVSNGYAVFLAGSFTKPSAIYRMDLETNAIELIRPTAPPIKDEVRACIAEPQTITFPSGPDGEAQAHAFYYAPKNPNFKAPEGEKPPLMILIHGGPTAPASAGLDMTIPFFTSRGFAVVDVNYRGSTGFGRAFRRAMYGAWGKVDVEDCVGAVKALVQGGHVDPYRVVSRGGSSGGFTTLALATFTDQLGAAASYYGISNLEMIAKVTDKLEARYAELLLGPYPMASKLFRARSPLFHVGQIDCPIILFQGTEDPVVPPQQAHVLIDELNARKLPHAFEFYDGEGHGFGRASSIVDSVEKELSFYGTFLGFVPAEPLREPRIHNYDSDATR
ncbi:MULTISPECIES: prolyl oligopeptidase family serine peptidase [Falsihalocynthiibacter]|uniref:S9 family peptidase n=1 Tax=Falsihalocynthiibacter TaxID=2854182 RepID=UPI0030010E7B